MSMSKFDDLTDRATTLASNIGDGLKDHLPHRAMKWIETGAALGALRTGSRVATKLVRRNPAIAVATLAGAGIVWYAARRRAQRAQEEGNLIEGESRRVTAKRVTNGNRSASPRRRATASA